MGVPQIDPQTRGLIPLRFCEYNHIVPLRLDGRKLTVAAAHPDSYEIRPALAGLRAKYDVEIVQVSETEIRSIIDANYYGKCESCGAKIDYGCKWCTTCKLRMSAQPAPAPPPPSNNVAVAQNQVSADVVAGPGLAGKNCPFCQTPIKPDTLVHECDACGIPHHSECWYENGGCTTFGCPRAVSGPALTAQPQFVPVPPPAYGQQPPAGGWQMNPVERQTGAYGAPQPYQPGYQAPGYRSAGIPNIKDYLVESILVTLFCCIPLGIAAIVFSVQARTKISVGDYAGAQAAANTARTLVWVSLGITLAFSIIALLSSLGSGGY